MQMNHTETRRDISGADYIQVEDDEFKGQFQKILFQEEYHLMASMMTLKHSPDGWIDRAEAYLEDEGFNVV